MSSKQAHQSCRFFSTDRGCRKGEACKFLHAASTDESKDAGKSTKLCRFFFGPAGCRSGEKCLYLHDRDSKSKDKKQKKPNSKNKVRDEDSNNNVSVDKRIADLKEIACGQCDEIIKMSKEKSAHDMLLDHYIENISSLEGQHLKLFWARDEFSMCDFKCFSCKKTMNEKNPDEFIEHLVKGTQSQNKKRIKHKIQLKNIAMAFVERDCLKVINPDEAEDDLQEKFEKLAVKEPTATSDKPTCKEDGEASANTADQKLSKNGDKVEDDKKVPKEDETKSDDQNIKKEDAKAKDEKLTNGAESKSKELTSGAESKSKELTNGAESKSKKQESASPIKKCEENEEIDGHIKTKKFLRQEKREKKKLDGKKVKEDPDTTAECDTTVECDADHSHCECHDHEGDHSLCEGDHSQCECDHSQDDCGHSHCECDDHEGDHSLCEDCECDFHSDDDDDEDEDEDEHSECECEDHEGDHSQCEGEHSVCECDHEHESSDDDSISDYSDMDNDESLSLMPKLTPFIRSLLEAMCDPEQIAMVFDADAEEDSHLFSMFSHLAAWEKAKKNGPEYEEEKEQRACNNGFTEDEIEELACQGIKPWDSEAWDALGVLYDYGDDCDFDYGF